MTFKTIYLTGAPSAGKSSTTRALRGLIPSLDVWEYGSRLTAYLQDAGVQIRDQDELRSRSAAVVTSKHIAEVDVLLLNWVKTNRSSRHLLIDSHPVTKERYGYRVTAFSTQQIMNLSPDEIWVLYTPPEVTIARLKTSAAGRPLITEEESRLHTHLQGSLAISYGISVGKPVYFFDSDRPLEELACELAARLK